MIVRELLRAICYLQHIINGGDIVIDAVGRAQPHTVLAMLVGDEVGESRLELHAVDGIKHNKQKQ